MTGRRRGLTGRRSEGRSRVPFARVDGAGHIDIHMVDSDRYMRMVIEFATRVRPASIH